MNSLDELLNKSDTLLKIGTGLALSSPVYAVQPDYDAAEFWGGLTVLAVAASYLHRKTQTPLMLTATGLAGAMLYNTYF